MTRVNNASLDLSVKVSLIKGNHSLSELALQRSGLLSFTKIMRSAYLGKNYFFLKWSQEAI